MTAPDYPVLSLGGYETYQLAHIATFIADRLARHRVSRRGRAGRADRAAAVRDLALGSTAFDAALGATGLAAPHGLPRPLDAATYRAARDLIGAAPRSADVVSLAAVGKEGWAVVGHVPGLGSVGAAVSTQEVAEALRGHMLVRPVAELAPWVVTDNPITMPALPERIDLTRAVQQLDPGELNDRAAAGALRGRDPYTDAAIGERFQGVDLNAQLLDEIPVSSSIAAVELEPGADADRADHEGRAVGDDPATLPQPDQDGRQAGEGDDPEQPVEQGVGLSQGDHHGRDQLDVAPSEQIRGPDGQDDSQAADTSGHRDGLRTARAGDGGHEEAGTENRRGEHIGQTRLPGVDQGRGRTEQHQRQQNQGRSGAVRREGWRDARQRHDRRGLGPARQP